MSVKNVDLTIYFLMISIFFLLIQEFLLVILFQYINQRIMIVSVNKIIIENEQSRNSLKGNYL